MSVWVQKRHLKKRPCLRCGRMMKTTVGRRICAKCHEVIDGYNSGIIVRSTLRLEEDF